METMTNHLVLFCSIFNAGTGSKKIKLANELGNQGNIVFYGRGILSHQLLNFLGITETKKEMLMTIIDKDQEDAYYQTFTQAFDFEKPHHGIVFSMPIKYKTSPKEKLIEGEAKMAYEAIIVVVNKGKIEEVVEAAEKAGCTGGTILHGRGAGKKEAMRLFNIDIEPEKEVLLVLSNIKDTERIVNSIQEELDLDEKGGGILFVMDVNQAVGLYKEEK